MSIFGLAQVIGSASGKAIAAIVVTDPNKWFYPFIIFSIGGFILIFLFLFTLDPKRGSTEVEFTLEDTTYDYTIKKKDLPYIIRKRTNINLIIQGFFGQVFWGALTWVPFLFTSRLLKQGFSEGDATFTGNLIAAIFFLGGFFGVIWGAIGDKMKRKNIKKRPLVGLLGIMVGIPFFIAMLLIQFDISTLTSASSQFDIILGLIQETLSGNRILFMFVVSFIAAAFLSAELPNSLALGIDINLPEHRGTTFSLANFAMGIGRGMGSILVPMIASLLVPQVPSPDNIAWAIIILISSLGGQVWFLLRASNSSEKDYLEVKEILTKRAKT